MSMRVGLELTTDRIRAVTSRGWRLAPVDTFEIKWNPAVPEDAVSVLAKHLGKVDEVAIAVGLGFTHVKHLTLPPVSDDERRAMLTLEPDRFFATEGGEVVVATRRDSDLVFAADAQMAEKLIAAFERWGRVACVEPAPVSLARVLRHSHSKGGRFRLPSDEGEIGVVEIVAGVMSEARRVSNAETVDELADPPKTGKIKSEFVVAYGALLGLDAPAGEMLVSPAAAQRIVRRRRSSMARSAINMVLALAFAFAAVDRSRSRLLEREDSRIAELTPRAAQGAALQSLLAKLDLQSSPAVTQHRNADPVLVLAALTRRLPRDATVMSVRADGNDWQIDGTARDAGKIVPALDSEPMFEKVRFLAGSARFTEGNRIYESFSLAFRARD